jgi:hypothetical protein
MGRPTEPPQNSFRRIYLKDISARDAMFAILGTVGLAYKVQPEFIWVSTPEILRRESFEPLVTRHYPLTDPDMADEILSELRRLITQIIDPETGQPLSNIDFSPTTNSFIIHNIPSNFRAFDYEYIIEQIIRNLQQD